MVFDDLDGEDEDESGEWEEEEEEEEEQQGIRRRPRTTRQMASTTPHADCLCDTLKWFLEKIIFLLALAAMAYVLVGAIRVIKGQSTLEHEAKQTAAFVQGTTDKIVDKGSKYIAQANAAAAKNGNRQQTSSPSSSEQQKKDSL
jgi:hypothetical protein